MNAKKSLTPLLFLALALLTACVPSQSETTKEDATASSDWTLFSSVNLGFTFEYPSTWSPEMSENIEKEETVVYFDAACTEACGFLKVTRLTSKNNSDQFKNRAKIDFGMDEKTVALNATKDHVDLNFQDPLLPQVKQTEIGYFWYRREKQTMEIFNKKDRLYLIEIIPGKNDIFPQVDPTLIFDHITETFGEFPGNKDVYEPLHSL